MLENFARVLNGERLAGSGPAIFPNPYDKPPAFDLAAEQAKAWRLELESADYQNALAQAIEAVMATQAAKEDERIPTPAATVFNALATGQSLEGAASDIFRRGPLHWLVVDDRRRLLLGSPTWRGVMTIWLLHYFMHPHRARLRRCQRCSRWFVDMTRNKSSLRCSRACTIAWSNAQRKESGR